jgi:hypothetical protein
MEGSMASLLRPLTGLAIVGFVASLIVHLCSLAGQPNPFGAAAWGLHVGIFVVWFPTVLVARRLSTGARQADFWKATLRGCPAWVKTGGYLLVGYAVLNFVLFVATQPTRSGSAHGIAELRGFSGHWMVFYYLGAATLYSASRLGPQLERRCPLGHEISPFANYCETCGAAIGPPPIA